MDSRPLVLMVDDDPDIIAVTADMFEFLGYDVATADCPHTALEILHTIGDRVRLIFTDLMMPEMDGNAFADAARVIAPAVGIIYTSGQMGARDNTVFVSKPYTSATVAEAAERAMAA
jgi:CheY-like chemotaxis protein